MRATQLPHVFRREYVGTDVGALAAVNVKTTGRVTGTNFVDLHGHDEIMVTATLAIAAGAAPTVGDVDIELIPFSDDGSTQIGPPVVVGILSHRAQATVQCVIGLAAAAA